MKSTNQIIAGGKEDLQKSVSDTNISYFAKITDKKNIAISIQEIFQLIKTGENTKEIIQLLQKEPDKKKRDSIKINLPAVTPSALFEGARKLANLKEYSGIICMDFDYVDNPEGKKKELSKDPYCYMITKSPSGNGLKVFIKVEKDITVNRQNKVDLLLASVS